MESGILNFLAGGAAILLWLVIVLGGAIAMGFVVKNLALKKGYQVSFAWGFFFGALALLYWGLAPSHPELQAQIIAEGVRRAQNPPRP
ncbi:MAG: hypothetical protein ABFC62_06585 [Clostridiaceae bacterium]|nr:hypothetical protein [Eubacteriales bacterium]